MPAAADVVAGLELEPLAIASVSPHHMKTMAAILQDPNPIHFDVEAVRALGLGDRPINQGPLNMTYLLELVIRFAGDQERVRRFSTRFLGNVFAGERIECSGTVTAVDAAAGTAELELAATAGGRVVLGGTATVELAR